ncbi:MAG TPA: ATP synthase F0 subunit B [Polyangia bacterium]|jgi:F-type H+-transporting ATPase subunit b|nr:ATP synthase F0 subunit B [Polyangia bacterium]
MLVATLLIAPPEEASPPLIDLDGTVFVQFALFVIMLIVLSRVLFRPYLQMRAARHKGIEGAREEAATMQERARQTNADYDAKLTKARLRGAEERARLRGEGAIYERQVLGAARDESQKVLDAARGKIGADAGTARDKLAAESTALARQIVKKILGREAA